MPSIASRSAAFEYLALPLFPSLYNHAFWLVRNEAEAEDLVQETLTKALRAFDSFKPSTNFKAWIFRILRNTFFTSRTGIAASRTIFIEDHPDVLHTQAADPTPEEALLRLDNQAAVAAALGQLQPLLREALLLCDVEEMKYKDIALILDVPIGTVMSRVSRARQALRQLIQHQDQFGEPQ
jgi:RNA polymerase sigma factor (sigma-70 family)